MSQEQPMVIDVEDVNAFDQIIYYLCCVGSLGTVWLLRVIVTIGIQKALK